MITSITGVNGETGATVGSVDVSHTTHTAAGTYSSDYWSFTGTANYNNIANTTITDTINKANATIKVVGHTGVYDGAAHGATGSATGVLGENLSSFLNLGAKFTDVPGGKAHWTFSGAPNYNYASGDVDIVISKANPTCAVNGFTGPYDGTAYGATGSCKGVGDVVLAGLDLGASFTNVPGGTAN